MIIGISGLQRSGKDTLAAELQRSYGGTTLSFARQLKRCAGMIWGELPRDDRGRRLLQEFGTDAVRGIDPDAWLKAWFRETMRLCGPQVITSLTEHVWVPDVRFPNEVALIQVLMGVVVRLSVTPEQQEQRGGDMRRTSHESETALNGYDRFDLVIPSSASSGLTAGITMTYLEDQRGLRPGADADSVHDPEAMSFMDVERRG